MCLLEQDQTSLMLLRVSNVAISTVLIHASKQHWTAVKRIMRYLKKTKHYGLLYSRSKSDMCSEYSDSDYAGELDDRKSTSGHLFKLAGAAVSWTSKEQSTVSLSTAEAEYVALPYQVQHKRLSG